MKAVTLLLMVALAGCGRSDQSWAEGDSTAFPLTTPGTPLKVERTIIRLPGAPVPVGEPPPEGEAPPVEPPPAPAPPPTAPPEPPAMPRDTGQALLL